MRFIVFAGLLSLVAAAPVQEEKRQTDEAAPSLAFTGGALPPAFTPGAFPPEGSFTGSFVRPTGAFSHHAHGTGSFVRPTGSFTGTFARPTGVRTHRPHGTGAPAAAPPVSSAVAERDEEAPTGARAPHVRPTGSVAGSFERPTGTRAHHGRPTGTGAFEQPTGTFEAPTGAFTRAPHVRPSGSGRHGGFHPSATAAAPSAAPSIATETTDSADAEDPARL
ncbi:hypothetical protein L207DRAFT_97562 [Hyaloscypha variabilis F]|uniref:Uncharacterized protein n=1 Tax=Hyaloscypha variabilis (strain UAMH 11265 / GT02V1 / F) TaxID=1149755 RepID=A0A2J6RBN4_HYAVF|nr:hypothetical protein L207DRAFT_97562 [Hyaloscypha variabilis F]